MIENVTAYAEEKVSLIVKVNEKACSSDVVENTASVQVNEDPAVESNPVLNPVDPVKSVMPESGTEVEIGA